MAGKNMPDTKTFAQTVIHWQKQHGRHDLPWQNTRDAYHIWLSEIMLQQTQVATVIPYYRKFLERFPTASDLAQAEADAVMQHWSGLGYYSRARNLHKCAQLIDADYLGIFPKDPVLLETLPGVGRSTAAAIAVFSAGVKAAIMDGNVVRVFSRIFACSESMTDTQGKKKLWAMVEEQLPDTDIEVYTQGLMDLGAIICTRSRPQCGKCPFMGTCQAKLENRIDEFPVRKARKTIPVRHALFLVIQSDGHILLEKRPPNGIWGGLHALPECPIEKPLKSLQAIRKAIADRHPGQSATVNVTALAPFTHTFTHFRLEIIPCVITGQSWEITPENQQWVSRNKALTLGLPAPVRKIIENLED